MHNFLLQVYVWCAIIYKFIWNKLKMILVLIFAAVMNTNDFMGSMDKCQRPI